MSLNVINTVALLMALALSALGVLATGRDTEQSNTSASNQSPEPRRSNIDAESTKTLQDARGNLVPVQDYQRIVTLNAVADHLLAQLVEPQRLVGISRYTAATHPSAWRLSDKPTLSGAADLEALFALKPDLVIISKFTDESLAERIREQGIPVFDLGEMRGLKTTRSNVQQLGILLEIPQRAKTLLQRIDRDLIALKEKLEGKELPEGIYLGIIGDSLFGGTKNTSYADMLHYAGVKDLAAQRGYEDWPNYSAEQVLDLNPKLIVTTERSNRAICDHSTLRSLPACSPEGRIVTVPSALASDSGLGLIDAAALLQEQIHGPPIAPESPEK